MIEIYCDGGSREINGQRISGWGAACYNDRKLVGVISGAGLDSTNNQMEYFAVLMGASQYGSVYRDFVILSDSQLVVNQLNHRWKVKDGELAELRRRVDVACLECEGIQTFKWIPREQNKVADKLATAAMEAFANENNNNS